MRSHLLAALLAPALVACSSAATLYRRDAPPVEGRIVHTDRAGVIVATDDGLLIVPREAITDIDHPGNVALTIGALTVGVSAVAIVGALDAHEQGERTGKPDYGTGAALVLSEGVILMVAGLLPLLWGASTYVGSTRRAGRAAEPSVSVHVAPTGVLVRF